MGTKGNLKIFLVGVGSEKIQSKTLLILILQQPILAHFFSKLSLNQPSPKAFLSTGMEIPGLPGMCIWHLLSGFKNFTFCQQIVRQASIKTGCILYVLYVLMSHRTCRTLLYPVLKPFAHEKKNDLHYLVTSAEFLDSSICPLCGLPLFGLTSRVPTVTFLLVAQSWNTGS